MITISEPHYLLFHSADRKYTVVTRQRNQNINNSTVNAWEECSLIVLHSRRY